MLFVLVDAHSKWPEVFSMSTTTTNVTIEILRKIFAVHGLLKQLVSVPNLHLMISLFL